MLIPTLSEREFFVFQKLLFQEAGISLSDKKKSLVQSRLLKRILFYNLNSYTEYIRLVQINRDEYAQMLNLLTTNETYFFREIGHYEFLKRDILPKSSITSKFRVWSAASSVGAEAYTVAMILDSELKSDKWEIYGTDINSEVVKKARVGLYPESWLEKIPLEFREKYCLKGKGKYEGKFLIERFLVENMKFEVGNLLVHNASIGKFDLIFLRNVLIYFDNTTKQIVIDNVIKNLHEGGYLFISHTENLNMLEIQQLERIDSSIYRKKSLNAFNSLMENRDNDNKTIWQLS